ncbi:uncharacterized protein [Lolium perenne]|uniref:uncharacterized protein n=1 Tax=Lolium perenne TaxID=4522 RepID=UPI003A98CFD7
MAMGIQGYSELLAARYLPLMMNGLNRQWFNTLAPNSIDSWEEARAAFIQHFASAYTRATTIEDLDRSVQGPRESTRRWVQRWQDMWTTSSGISTDTTIYCFHRCCRYEPLSAKLRRHSQRDQKYSRRDNRGPREDRPPGKCFDARSLLDTPCIYHSKEGKPSTHTTTKCFSLKQIKKARRAKENGGDNPTKDRNKDQDHPKEDGFGRDVGSLHTFTGVGDRRDKKQSITWSREDHAPRIEYKGRVALIIKPKVSEYWLPKTLMDGGSSINIMYYDTFRRLGLPDSCLEHTSVTFHGIVPGRKAFPIGKVTLLVTFGTPANYRTERISFEVLNFRSPYHCVLGRKAFTKFMATSHYAYNMMKMSGPRGVITVHGDPDMALECKDNGAKLAGAVIAAERDNAAELAKYPVDHNDPTILEKPTELDSSEATFKPTTDTRQVDLVENYSSRQVTIGAGLSAQ